MGFKHGKAVLHSLPELYQRDIGDMLRGKARAINMPVPTISADCSNVAYKFPARDAQSVANWCVKTAKIGVKVEAVCDGVRPISKQATNERYAKREKARIKGYLQRLQILSLQLRLREDSLTESEKNDIRGTIATLQRSMKSKETQSRNAIQPSFEDRLEEELEATGAHLRNVSGGFVSQVMRAQYQADTVMMERAQNGETLMVASDDADISIISGDDCVSWKKYTGPDGTLEIVSTSLKTLQEYQSYLSPESRARTNIVEAKFPLFDGVTDRKLRALLSLYLGCDVYVGGLYGVGPPKLQKIIDEEFPEHQQEDPSSTLFSFLKLRLCNSVEGFDEDVVDTLIQGLICEPTNVAPTTDDGRVDDEEQTPMKTYLDGNPPQRLPKYLAQFAQEGVTTVFDGPAIATCKGVGIRSHTFLHADGCDKCAICEEIVCRQCRENITVEEDIGSGKKNKVTVTHCLQCYAGASIVPEADVEAGKSISEMREELASRGTANAQELTVEEVEDMYALKEVAAARANKLIDAVPFPIFPSSELDAEETDKWDTIAEINFGEGAAFLSDPNLDPKRLPNILDFFASLVTFQSKVRTDWETDPVLYEAIPSVLIEMAKKSRVDGGYRLSKRMVRHAFDSRCKSIDNYTGSLIVDKETGEVGVRLGTNVPASMRKQIYDTEVVATATNLLCCKCTCQCGSQDEQRIVCVHTIVSLYLLAILLVEDLAEHILIALASRVNGSLEEAASEEEERFMWNMSNWSDEGIESMKGNIVTLMEVAGELVSATDATNKSVPDLLKAFVVGTEKRKKERVKLPPKPHKLGPIHDMDLMSTTRRGKLTMHRNIKPKATTKDEGSEAMLISSPTDTDGDLCCCSWPICDVNATTDPIPTLVDCSNPSCSGNAHRLCQYRGEEKNGLSHEEEHIYCPKCHPKSTVAKENDDAANFEPNYVKVLALCKVASCKVNQSDFIGQKLLSLRGYKQMNGNLAQQDEAEELAKVEWEKLQKAAEQRSTNITHRSRQNLAKKPTDSTPNDGIRVVTPPEADAAPSGASAKKKKGTKQGKHIRCHKGKCPSNNKCTGKRWYTYTDEDERNGIGKNGTTVRFLQLPKYPAPPKSASQKPAQRIKHHGRKFLRRETNDRMGLSRDDKKTERYICSKHKFVEIEKGVNVDLGEKDDNGKPKTTRLKFKLTVPEATGLESNMNESANNKGVARDRGVVQKLKQIQEVIIDDGQVPPEFSIEEAKEELAAAKPTSMKERLEVSQEETILAQAELEHYQSELARANMATIQHWEQNFGHDAIPINPTVKRAAGLDVHQNAPSNQFNITPLPTKKKKKLKKDGTEMKPRHYHARDPPKVSLDLPDSDVKRRTGHPTMGCLLSYIFIVCNGDVEVMTKRRTVLSWFEAWFMHFEFKWGRTLTRVDDVAKKYGPHKTYINQEIDLKYSIERRALESWPKYASYEEDKKCRNGEKWDQKYDGHRIIFWDMTNIPAYGFTDADFNRMTYSSYYAMNCFKGGVGNQLCSWIVAGNLWPGAVSDTQYHREEGYLKEQETFQNDDLVQVTTEGSHEVLPFTNILDKGYRVKLICWRAGKQRTHQPVWRESDRRFTRNETLLTATVATDRGGNERSVKVCKRSWYVSRGLQPNQCHKRLNNAWKTWAFQANFMFKPVL